MNEIAIASVPIQEWEKPYELKEAFYHGSIFPQLHKPFYIEEQAQSPAEPLGEREQKLAEIQQTTFYLIDLTLFLDTHPGHPEALEQKRQIQEKRKELLKQFAEEYYPLTADCAGDAAKAPGPWEGGTAHVAL